MSDLLFIDESHHHPVEFVNPRLDDPFIVAIVGQIASGKTVLTQRLIHLWRFKFDIIVWISPTYGLQETLIKDHTGIVVFDTLSRENLEIIHQHQHERNLKRRENGEPPSRMLLILDDNGTKTRKLLEGGTLDNLLIKCRHEKVNIIQLAQRYTQLSPTLRANAKFLILFAECNPQERRNLYRFHGFGKKEFYLQTIEEKTKEKYSWIGLKCYPQPYRFFTAKDGYLF